jgi:DNA-directed RNA polymerase subunit RPC12/RpoP
MKDEALKLAFEALTYKKWFRIGMVEQNDPRVEAAITAIKEALAQPAQEWSWVCNECGAKEFTSALSEADLEYLACSGCGGNEFHKEALAPTSTQCEKQPAQEPVAWEDGSHLVVRVDVRDRLNYKGPWVDMGRAIPDKWVPVLYTTPPAAQPAAQPQQKAIGELVIMDEGEFEFGFTADYIYRRMPDLEKGTHLLYTTPQQQEPRNFCPRCGKRLHGMAFAAGGIHTCTPPEGGHQ